LDEKLISKRTRGCVVDDYAEEGVNTYDLCCIKASRSPNLDWLAHLGRGACAQDGLDENSRGFRPAPKPFLSMSDNMQKD